MRGGRPLSDREMDLAIITNAIVVPYILSQSYLVLIAMPWARLAVRRPWLAVFPYLVSLPVLFRAQGFWDRLGLVDVTFPLLLLAILLLEGYRSVSVSPSNTRSQEMSRTRS